MQQHQPIVSLSLNPAIDLTYQITVLKHEHKSRATKTRLDPGGTGINVGRALAKLNNNSSTCSVIAGKMGEFLELMLKNELSNLYTLQVEGETRINTTVLQRTPQHQYEINAAGPTLTADQLNKISQQFLKCCGQGIGILTGSLPPGIDDDTYSDINLKLINQGARAIIDAPVSVLKKTLSSKPFLIKPNLDELQTLTNKSLTTLEQIAVEARRIVQQGTTYVCVSLGEQGALLSGPDNSYYCPPPAITINSTVGAGDSMVAGLAHVFAQNNSPEQALKFAVACGAGTAMQPGTQLFLAEQIDSLSKNISVKILDI